jgi:hypothetical protein
LAYSSKQEQLPSRIWISVKKAKLQLEFAFFENENRQTQESQINNKVALFHSLNVLK